MDVMTSIRVSKETKKLLQGFKVHKRQSDDEILLELIGRCKKFGLS